MQITKEFICSCGVAFVAVSDKHVWQHIIPSNSHLSLSNFFLSLYTSFAILASFLLLFTPTFIPLSQLSFQPVQLFSVFATKTRRRKLRKKKEISNFLLIFFIRLDLGLLLYWIISFKDQVFSFAFQDFEFPMSFSIWDF